MSERNGQVDCDARTREAAVRVTTDEFAELAAARRRMAGYVAELIEVMVTGLDGGQIDLDLNGVSVLAEASHWLTPRPGEER